MEPSLTTSRAIARSQKLDPINGEKLQKSGADWITFTSASTVEHFHARFNLPQLLKQFPEMKLASIGPETSKALVALDLTPDLKAKVHTADGWQRCFPRWRVTGHGVQGSACRLHRSESLHQQMPRRDDQQVYKSGLI